MRYLYSIFVFLLILSISSCRKDFSTSLSNGNLKFSQDTIFLNSVFDNISSSTHRFTVKNTSDLDITIPVIALERGDNSFYRLNVDGIAGKSFQNIDVLAKDSIFVFVEATVDFSQVTDLEFMYRDKILFDSGVNQQKVDLEAQVVDVHLIRPDRTAIENGFTYEQIVLGQDADSNDITIRGTNLTDDTVFTNDKPWLIYNYIGVPSGKTLTIEAGTNLHFHANSGIIVQEGGTLKINGTLTEKVIIQGDRLEEVYQDIPGQWGTIWLLEGSENSKITHAQIYNATIGVLADSNTSISTNTLEINNSEIYNTTSFGMLGRNAKITANNLVIGNTGSSAFANMLGGTYNFTHCTLATYWRNSNRQDAALSLSNNLQISQTDFLVSDLTAKFTNCILYGNQNLELSLNKLNDASFDYLFKNCLIRFNDSNNQFDTDPLYDFTNTTHYQNTIFNQEPDFRNTNANEDITSLEIGDNSAANGQADTTILNTNPILQTDILGVNRMTLPDIGAYQHVTFEED